MKAWRVLLWILNRFPDALLIGAGAQVGRGAEDQALLWILAAAVLRVILEKMKP